MKKCLFCYQPIPEEEIDFHSSCRKKFFGEPDLPELLIDELDLERLANEIVKSHTAVTGVQPKLSLDLSPINGSKNKRFTITGLKGGYILKPPSNDYPQLPEIEDLTMHMASIARIKVVPHSLIRMKSGTLAYITKRVDRTKKGKLHMEDMCQLTERLTEDKYRGSYEQIAKAINKYSVNPGLDLFNFFELVMFCFITGNADMHLKNFSLLYQDGIDPALSPAYDLVATVLLNPLDDEDLALTLNGKKRKIKRTDFETIFKLFSLNAKQVENIFKKMSTSVTPWMNCIDSSFLTEQLKLSYKDLILERWKRMQE